MGWGDMLGAWDLTQKAFSRWVHKGTPDPPHGDDFPEPRRFEIRGPFRGFCRSATFGCVCAGGAHGWCGKCTTATGINFPPPCPLNAPVIGPPATWASNRHFGNGLPTQPSKRV